MALSAVREALSNQQHLALPAKTLSAPVDSEVAAQFQFNEKRRELQQELQKSGLQVLNWNQINDIAQVQAMLEIVETTPRGSAALAELESKLGVPLAKVPEPSKETVPLIVTESDVINANSLSSRVEDIEDALEVAREVKEQREEMRKAEVQAATPAYETPTPKPASVMREAPVEEKLPVEIKILTPREEYQQNIENVLVGLGYKNPVVVRHLTDQQLLELDTAITNSFSELSLDRLTTLLNAREKEYGLEISVPDVKPATHREAAWQSHKTLRTSRDQYQTWRQEQDAVAPDADAKAAAARVGAEAAASQSFNQGDADQAGVDNSKVISNAGDYAAAKAVGMSPAATFSQPNAQSKVERDNRIGDVSSPLSPRSA